MIVTNLVLVNLSGEAYHSGAYACSVGIIPKDLFEEYQEDIIGYTPYFDELDGKHSQVEGEVNAYSINLNNLKDSILELEGSDCTYHFDNMLRSIFTLEEIQRIEDINEKFKNSYTTCTKTVVTFNGEEI